MHRFLAIFLLACAATSAEVPLVARFDMEKDPSVENQLQDTTGKHHGRLLNGAELVPGGRSGNALHLHGGGARAEIPADPMLDALVSDFTIALWVKPERKPDGDSTQIITKRTQWWMTKPFSIDWLSDGALLLSTNDGAWRNPRGGTLAVGEWHHLALTAKRGAQAVLWLDGAKTIELDLPRSLSRNGEPLVLGFEPAGDFAGGKFRPFVGLIDDLRIYATSLDASQIAAVMAGTLATRPATQADLPGRHLESTPPAATTAVPATDAPLSCELVVDRDLSARGLWYEEASVAVEKIEAGGRQLNALVCKGGSAPGVNYARSLRLSCTDPRFREGRMPVVDIEVEFSHPHWSGVEVKADTARGPQKVGEGWGGNDALKTIRVQLDDARFAGTDNGTPDRDLGPDGYDLRINGFSGDMRIRRVTVTGYDRQNDPDWRRLLKLQSVQAPGREVFAFAAGEPLHLDWRFRNLALVPVDSACTWRIVGRDGKVLASGTKQGMCAANGELVLSMEAASRGLPFGIYEATLALTAKRKSGPVEVLTRTVTLALGSPAVLAKAAPGEFLYGLDVALGETWANPRYLAWMHWMGVDLVRAGASMHEFDKAMPVFRREGLQVMPMPEAAYDADDGRRAQLVREAAEQAAGVAKRHPDIRWYEIGNEPDLGFYKGPIEDYAVGMAEIAKAIRQANPLAMPMNGGLSFFGDEGTRRSQRLLEVADVSNLKALAYHGHGALVGAEKGAYERMQSAAATHGRSALPLIETESGVAAGRSPQQEDVQARTVVEKMVYAQGQGMPLFIFFRLHFEEADSYGMLYDQQEPRPSVLSYRNLVEQTRGLRCGPRLDLGDPDLYAYAFAAGNRRCLVTWLSRPETASASVALAAGRAAITGLRVTDHYGNPLAIPPLAGPVATLAITEQPQFISWTGAAIGFPAAAPAPLRLAGCEVATGIPGSLQVIVRNADTMPLVGEVRITVTSHNPVTPATCTLPVTVAPGAEATVHQVLRVAAGAPITAWPQTWTIFEEGPGAAPDLTTITSLPATWKGPAGAPVAGRRARLQDDRLDLAALTGSIRERKSVVCFAEIECAAAGTIAVGASADWWMEWYINGQKGYSTLDRGNGSGFRLTDHRFTLPVHAGRNLLAVRALSGSQGFVLICGGAEELRRVDSTQADRVEAVLVVGGAVIARSVNTLQVLTPLPSLPEGGRTAMAALPALAELAEPDLTNLFVQHPDSSRWWHGDGDLSARVWATADTKSLDLLVAVRDDQQRTGGAPATLPEQDSLQLGVAGNDEGSVQMWTIGTSTKGPGAWRSNALDQADPDLRIEIERDEAGKLTWYRCSIPRSRLPQGALRLNLQINDNDDGFRKQFLRWRPSLNEHPNIARWYRVMLP